MTPRDHWHVVRCLNEAVYFDGVAFMDGSTGRALKTPPAGPAIANALATWARREVTYRGVDCAALGSWFATVRRIERAADPRAVLLARWPADLPGKPTH